jgi:inosine/xanthosine triphosphate pyrophosphatase family protein
LFTAHIHGVIAPEPRGMMQPHLWSKLALIFVPDGRDQTLAEMTKEEYAALWKSLPPETSSGRMFGQWYVNNRMKD